MSSSNDLSASGEVTQKGSKSSKRHSWFGSTLKHFVGQTAVNTKAAIESVRARMESPTIPMPDADCIDLDDVNRPPISQRASPRHRRTISTRSALASLRSHLPRRSFDHKQHSFADLLHRNGGEDIDIAGPERFYTSPSKGGPIAINKRQPNARSPIDIFEATPTLKLDLGPPSLDCFSVDSAQDIRPQDLNHKSTVILVGKPTSPSKLLHVYGSKRPTSPGECLVPDPLQPVAEARNPHNGHSRLSSDISRDARDTIVFDSPLPGTTLQMEFEKTHPDIASADDLPALVEERQVSPATGLESSKAVQELSKEITRHDSFQERSTEAVAESTVDPNNELKRSIAAADAFIDDTVQQLHHTVASTARSDAPSKAAKSETAYSGPPSPDRLVRLPIRTKSAFLGNAKSSLETQRGRRIRRADESDLTVALLRERTSDDYTFMLDKLNLGTDSPASLRRQVSGPHTQLAGSAAVPASPTTPTKLTSDQASAISPPSSRIQGLWHNADAEAATEQEQTDGQSACDAGSSSPLTRHGIFRQRPNGSSLTASSSSPFATHLPEQAAHNHFSLLAIADDSDEEDGEDMPDCFNIGSTYG